MTRAFWWRNRRVEIQTDYHAHGVRVLVKIDGQEIGQYNHFEEALAAIQNVVVRHAPQPSSPGFWARCDQPNRVELG